MNHQAWLASVLASWEGLKTFAERTSIPGPIPHRYLGRAIADTQRTLVAPVVVLREIITPTLQSQPLPLQEERDELVVHSLQLAHRVFFAGVHTAVESGLVYICEEQGWQVESGTGRKIRDTVARIREKVDTTDIQKELTGLENGAPKHPLFDDYFNTVLKRKKLAKEFQKDARAYFRCLGILRNKSSHALSDLTPIEAETLRTAGWINFVGSDDQLVTSTGQYAAVCTYLLEFLDTIYSAPATSASAATP